MLANCALAAQARHPRGFMRINVVRHRLRYAMLAAALIAHPHGARAQQSPSEAEGGQVERMTIDRMRRGCPRPEHRSLSGR